MDAKKEPTKKKTTKKDPIAKENNPTAPAPVVQRTKQPEQNGVVRPKDGTACGKIWAIADKMTAELGTVVDRKDVMAEAAKVGVNACTCSTQYARWRKYNGYQAVRHSLPTKEEREKGLKGVVEESPAPMVVTEAGQAAPAPEAVYGSAAAEVPAEVPVASSIGSPAEAPVAMCAPA